MVEKDDKIMVATQIISLVLIGKLPTNSSISISFNEFISILIIDYNLNNIFFVVEIIFSMFHKSYMNELITEIEKMERKIEQAMYIF